MPTQRERHPSAKLFPLAVLSAAFLVAFYPVWEGLVRTWYGSEDYSHGFLVLPVVAYIIYQKRESLRAIAVKPSVPGLLISIFSLLVYFLAVFGEIGTLRALSMVAFIAGGVIYIAGWQMFRALLFPLFILLFMIPVPSQILSALTIPLQLIVSKASVLLSQFAGIPVYREGNVIHLPERTLQVVQACSGLRSMMSLMLMGALVGYFFLSRQLLRTVLFFSSIPTAILVNIVRVTAMVFAFHYFGYDLATGSVHTTFGVVIFFLALAVLALVRGGLSFWDR